jgi:hypothetical protein
MKTRRNRPRATRPRKGQQDVGAAWIDARTAFDDTHSDLARTYSLARAAKEALDYARPAPTPEVRRFQRSIDALVYAVFYSARDALKEADRALNELEGRTVVAEDD